MQEDSSYVANCLAYATETDDDGICSYAVDDTKYDLADGTNGEDGYEDGVGDEVWSVAVNCVVDRAVWGNYFAFHVDGSVQVLNDKEVCD